MIDGLTTVWLAYWPIFTIVISVMILTVIIETVKG